MQILDQEAPAPGRGSTRRGVARRLVPLDALWLLIIVGQLVLVWAFPRLPTQDGPVHVASAIAFRDLGEPGTRYAELFERRIEPFPNWTSHLLLAGLSWAVDAVVAEKLLVSFFLLLWPLAVWRLASSVGGDRTTLAGVGLLLALGRAFWLGFYNFLIGATLAFLVVAWIEGRRRGRSVRDVPAMAALLLAVYFTHLGAWLLAVAAALALATVSADRARRLPPLLLAAVPGQALAVVFVLHGGMGASASLRRALRSAVGPALVQGPGTLLSSLGLEWFPARGREWATVLAVAMLACVLVGAFVRGRDGGGGAGSAPRRVLLTLGGVGLLAFALGPADLGVQAGYLRARLALVAPVLVVAGSSVPRSSTVRRATLATLVVLNLVNLGLVASFLSRANADLREFTAATEAVGRGKTLYLIKPEEADRPFAYVNANLYCLGTGNAVATNYQAGTGHFPLRYRPGVRKAVREMVGGMRPAWTDVVLLWETSPRGRPELVSDYVEVYRRRRLRVFARRTDDRGSGHAVSHRGVGAGVERTIY